MDSASLRRVIYGLLLAVTAGITTARIVGAELVYEPSIAVRPWPKDRPEKMPTFGSNDRSRWATVRALVENNTYIIGERQKIDSDTLAMVVGTAGARADKGYRDTGILFTDGYKTIDVVKNPETHKFYSSKPPLFTTVVAGEYWVLRQAFGWTLENPEFRWPIVCTILITVNVLPLIVMLMLLARLLEEYGDTDFGRVFVYVAACFGTFMTTFAVTLNNHTPAACCVMIAIYPLLNGRSIDAGRSFTFGELFISGFFAGLAAAIDLPAAAFTASLALVVLIKSPRAMIVFLPAVLIPVAAFFVTNQLAIGDWRPAYSKYGTPWYEYEGSHWIKAKINPDQKGIDFAREPKEIYALHMLVGHHGLFSLTPIWLISFFGMLRAIWSRTPAIKALGSFTLLMTLAVCTFYIMTTNNYDGWTSGPRWAFWLTPLLLLTMLPAVDEFGKSGGGRLLCGLFLAASAFSAAFPIWNPWRHPWPYVLCEYMNWVKY